MDPKELEKMLKQDRWILSKQKVFISHISI